ncbi:MAG TPA: amidase [Pirellulales bacterium]|nr:amidase [Pirellulales bacterium]
MREIPTLSAARAELQAGTQSPLGLLEDCLRNLHAAEQEVRAWVVVDEAAARRRAEELAALRPEQRAALPLFGIPLGVKDIIDVAGLPTRSGSAYSSAAPALRDAPLVGRLRAAGAIVLGKTVTTEYAYLDPPVTRNPWNLERTPGGSSSGSAAAVAARMCCAALGTQTGGSVIRPAAFCGVVGFKPSFGWCDLAGVFPLAPTLDHLGLLTRSVADAAHLFDVLADAPASNAAAADEPPRLGRFREFFQTHAAPVVQAGLDRAFDQLRRAGAEVFDLALPQAFAAVIERHFLLMSAQTARIHQDAYERNRGQLGPRLREFVERGLSYTAAEFDEAVVHQQAFRETMESLLRAERCVAAMPSALTAAVPPETTGDARFTAPWSYSGLPAISLPCGLDPEGLPLGLQLVGSAGDERALLRSAAWCESALNFTARPQALDHV